MQEFLRRSVKATIILIIIVAIALIGWGKLSWAGGFIVAGAWSVINLLLTVKLLKIAMFKQSKAGLRVFLMLKFPLLYLVGIGILISRVFPVESLLIGLLPLFIVMGIVKLCDRSCRI